VLLTLLLLLYFLGGIVYIFVEDNASAGVFLLLCGATSLLVIYFKVYGNEEKPNAEGLVVTSNSIYVIPKVAPDQGEGVDQQQIGPNEVILEGVEDVADIIVSVASVAESDETESTTNSENVEVAHYL